MDLLQFNLCTHDNPNKNIFLINKTKFLDSLMLFVAKIGYQHYLVVFAPKPLEFVEN